MMGISFAVSTCAIGLAIANHGGCDSKLVLLSLLAPAPAPFGARVSPLPVRRASGGGSSSYLEGFVLIQAAPGRVS
jgi:hypothetical protein